MKGAGTVSRDFLDLGRSSCVDNQVGHFCKDAQGTLVPIAVEC